MTSPISRSRKYWAMAALNATNCRWKLRYTTARDGRRDRPVVEGPPIRQHPIARLVAQRMMFLDQVQRARARPALDAHAAVVEHPHQDADDLEDLHALVLIDVVQLGRCVELALDDGVVEVRLRR